MVIHCFLGLTHTQKWGKMGWKWLNVDESGDKIIDKWITVPSRATLAVGTGCAKNTLRGRLGID